MTPRWYGAVSAPGGGHARYGHAVLVVGEISLKGGVGKTSLVLGLAGAAWERGHINAMRLL